MEYLFFFSVRGINTKRLTSIMIQAVKKELVESASSTDISKVAINKRCEG